MKKFAENDRQPVTLGHFMKVFISASIIGAIYGAWRYVTFYKPEWLEEVADKFKRIFRK